uniref:DNA 3'-5' helicase n=1 Tax=Amphimedon queenslandica TaxID=400682 RepID=A0A1X7VQK6_AMPQE
WWEILRILIATIAFGIGIDCPDIRRFIHWGPPSDSESYIHETERTGRDSRTANAILYYSPRDLSHLYMDSNMPDYCTNTSTCRRQVLFEGYDYNAINKPVDCKCCNLCALICN